MNEKEVDVYLSLASLSHLMMLGAGGGLVAEIFAESSRFEIVLLAALGLICFAVLSIVVYARTFDIIRNQNK